MHTDKSPFICYARIRVRLLPTSIGMSYMARVISSVRVCREMKAVHGTNDYEPATAVHFTVRPVHQPSYSTAVSLNFAICTKDAGRIEAE